MYVTRCGGACELHTRGKCDSYVGIKYVGPNGLPIELEIHSCDGIGEAVARGSTVLLELTEMS